MGDLRERLARADDAAISRVVALVDGLGSRGEADALIAPLRPRLQRLRPKRPPGLGRLLFVPLDPLIVQLAYWQPGRATIPRPALRFFIDIVQAGLGAEASRMRTGIEADPRTRDSVAKELWSAGAPMLRSAANDRPPDGWTKAGLPAESFRPLCRGIAGLLAQAEPIDALVRSEHVSEDTVRPVLRAVGGDGEEALRLLIALLLAALPEPDRTLRLLRAIAGPDLDRTVNQVLEGEKGSRLLGLELHQATREVRRIIELAESLSHDASSQRRALINTMRAEMAAACQRPLETAVREELLDAAEAMPPSPDDEAVVELEDVARKIRGFETQARHIGDAAALSGVLHDAVEKLPHNNLPRADHVRLVEILLGSERAMEIWKQTHPRCRPQPAALPAATPDCGPGQASPVYSGQGCFKIARCSAERNR